MLGVTTNACKHDLTVCCYAKNAMDVTQPMEPLDTFDASFCRIAFLGRRSDASECAWRTHARGTRVYCMWCIAAVVWRPQNFKKKIRAPPLREEKK